MLLDVWGGIWDNQNFQSDYIYINTMIGMNIINSSFKNNVKKLINLGSSCIYPKEVKQPISESSLLSSSLEKTNEGYALSKIVTLKYCQYLKQKIKKILFQYNQLIYTELEIILI